MEKKCWRCYETDPKKLVNEYGRLEYICWNCIYWVQEWAVKTIQNLKGKV